jgi:hypothetical protein
MAHKGKPKNPPTTPPSKGNKTRYTAKSQLPADSDPGKKRDCTDKTMSERRLPTKNPTAAATIANTAEIKISRASLVPSLIAFFRRK